MSSFVPLPGAPTDPAPEPIPGDGFYPAVDLAALRASVRIDPTVTPERLREAAIAAILAIGQELATWRQAQELAGVAKLEDVPPRPGQVAAVAGVKAPLHHYARAVASLVAADLGEKNRDAGTTLAGHDRADELEVTADTHRRNYRWALSDLVGRPRSTVELI